MTVSDRVKDKVLAAAHPTETEQSNCLLHLQLTEHGDGERDMGTVQPDKEGRGEESENETVPFQTCKKAKMTPLEDDDLKRNLIQSTLSIQEKTYKELEMYRDMPPIMTSEDPALWWWNSGWGQKTEVCRDQRNFLTALHAGGLGASQSVSAPPSCKTSPAQHLPVA
ncbi:hypothetical protein SKAU_G00133610 [Synaphobranchus kaupii]|uniref:Uncharacterized protein n=1 Tax=Synaphobranchus kaupii TaxID=118154 RepID=A0A9Q1FRL8_SYNKA|nr:hypothetical protein SKAU_G00133610 [Synaphobranchus kaupii]